MKMLDCNIPIGCVVTIRSKAEKKCESSASGFVIDYQNGFVLTHGSILTEHLQLGDRCLKLLRKKAFINEQAVPKDLSVDIVLPGIKLEKYVSQNSNAVDIRTSLSNAILPTLSKKTNYCNRFSGTLHCVFQIKSLRQILNKLMPQESWDFVDDVSDRSTGKEKNTTNSAIFYQLLPCFALIKLYNWFPLERVFKMRPCEANMIGDPVEVIATPFGGLNPDVFLNSRSSGIISNSAGKHQVLLMTDARCVPGSEGGVLLYKEANQRFVIGVIIATLCWKNNEWIGLSMACSLPEIMKVMETIPGPYEFTIPVMHANTIKDRLSMHLEYVPLISVRGSWGSGFVVHTDDKETLLLTCSHVVKESEHSPVNVKWSSGKCGTATVLYKSSTPFVFDLALLSYRTDSNQLKCAKPRILPVSEGTSIYAIGHAVFNQEHDIPPTVTSGIISKVLKNKNTTVMIQTTCAIHAGASGGPMLNKNGEVIGVTVCNAKDVSSGASYPHINMCVPMETIYPIIQEYIHCRDKKVLQQLQIKEPLVQCLWSLESKHTGSALKTFVPSSKL